MSARAGERMTCIIRWAQGDKSEEVFATGVPGLFVYPLHDDAWELVHFRSGLLIGYTSPSPEGAVAAAHKLAEVVDWTASAEDVRLEADTVKRCCDELGLERRSGPRTRDYADRNVAWPRLGFSPHRGRRSQREARDVE